MHKATENAGGAAPFERRLLMAGIVATLLMSASHAHAQGFSSALVHSSPNAYYSAPSLVVRNVSTPTFHLLVGAGKTDGSGWTIRYATRTGSTGTWSIDSSLTTVFTGGFQSLAIESSSPYNPHVVTTDGTVPGNQRDWVVYATRSNGTWTTEAVVPHLGISDTVIAAAPAPGITLDPSGVPYIAYSLLTQNPGHSRQNELWVAHRLAANNWAREQVMNSTWDEYADVHIKVSTSNVIHLSYERYLTNPNPPHDYHYQMLWQQNNGSWSAPELVEADSVTIWNDLALGGNTPHMVYLKYDQSGVDHLMYAYRDPSYGWQKTDVGPSDQSPVSLALSVSYPLIAYKDDNSDSTRFASKSIYGWNYQRVVNVSSPLSLSFYASGGANRPQIAYTDDRLWLASGTQYGTNNSLTLPDDGGWVSDGTRPLLTFVRPIEVAVARNAMTATIDLTDPVDLRLDVFDLAGRRLTSQEFGRISSGSSRLGVSFAAPLSRGVYFAQFNTTMGARFTMKFVAL